MRSFLSPKSLVRRLEPRSTRLSHSARLLIRLKLQVQLLLPPRVTTCSPFDRTPNSPAYLPQLPPSVNTPSLGENDPSAVRPTYPNATLLAADWYLTAVAPDWHDTTRGSCRFWAQDLRLCNLLIPLGTRTAEDHTTHDLPSKHTSLWRPDLTCTFAAFHSICRKTSPIHYYTLRL